MTDVTWLTQEAFDRLHEELSERQGPRRTEITQRIAAAREEGDLKENGGYHAAKEEQGKNEARIRVLKHMLENCRIGVPEAADGEVVQGMIVTVSFPDLQDEETFLLGSREEAGLTDVEVYSATSPLGAAVLGCKVNDETSYSTPNGKTIRVVVTNVRPNT
jgi:transcription elongation factor GreA